MNPPAPADEPLAPGSWLGMMGGGQLGRMFCMAAQSLGYRVLVIDPAASSPAGSIADRHLQADYLDESALAEMARVCSVVSTEFENVPAAALARLERDCRVTPGAQAVSIAQDRIAEKCFIESCGVPVAPYRAVLTPADLEGIDSSLLPGILKVARLGYDGKGQARVANVAEALSAFGSFSASGTAAVACVLEKQLELAMEISVIVARSARGDSVTFPIAQNVHRDGILAVSTVPAAIGDDLAGKARSAALEIAARLGYVGVLCIEFFVLADGSLVVNEMAPRPHNSGHYSIDAVLTSQFEQQARVMAGLPLGATRLMAPAVMINILGDAWLAGGVGRREPDWSAVLSEPGAKLHLYGKEEARQGRKMGHVTVLADTVAEARAQAAVIAPLIAQRVD